MNHSIGSQWKRWDLHIHSPESILNMQFDFDHSEDRNNYGGNIWDKYIDKIEANDNNISVIAITDYCSIDGYEKVLEYKSAGRLENFDLILANVEFRTLPVTERNNAINIHCIFSNDLSIPEIKRFLNELKYDYNQRSYRCNKDELMDLGKAYKPQLTSEKECYREGVNQFKVNIAQLREIIDKEQRYKDKVFIVVSNSTHDGASGLRESSTDSFRQQIYRYADFIFSGNEQCRRYFLGQGPDSKDEIIRKCGALKPCIHGSDAHDFGKLFNPDLDRYCWIKAEPTFEGLRQLMYEPESRVRIHKDEPDTKKNIYSIKKFAMDNINVNRELTISEVNMQLNNNLVAIIGGKGSGKTAIIDLVANCYHEYDRSRHYDIKGKATKDNEDKNSFVQRIERECKDLEIQIGYLDEQVTFTKRVTDNIFFENGQLRYLPQGKIEEVAGNTEALHKDIQHLIFNHFATQNNDEYHAYEEIGKTIKFINREISALLNEVNILSKETSSEILSDLQRQLEIKKGELKDKEIKLHAYEGELTKEEEQASVEATNKIQDIEKRLARAKEYIETSEELLKDIQTIQEDYNLKINNLNQQIIESDMKQVPIIDFSNIIDALTFNKNYAVIRKQYFDEQKRNHAEEIKAFTGKQSEQAILLKDRDTIQNAITDIEKNILKVNQRQEEYTMKENELFTKHEELLNHYRSQKNSYDRIIESFKLTDVDILSSIDFKAEIHFHEREFLELAEDLFDGRKLPTDFLENIVNTIQKAVLNGEPITFPKIDLVQGIFRKNKTIFDYFKWLTQDYYRLDTKVSFNGTELSKLSVGQKGAVILKLYLADGDYPIILDQPEDNLDNRFISEELITAFRKAKEKRQIIIATHNANLVVNSDAEQIIVADFNNNRISYKSGSIENIEIRSEVASLLEGGEDAFRQRENKYGFSR
jgi:ABC-type lipoprotein export system ATPase subunit